MNAEKASVKSAKERVLLNMISNYWLSISSFGVMCVSERVGRKVEANGLSTLNEGVEGKKEGALRA